MPPAGAPSPASPTTANTAADIDASLPTRERLVLAALHLFWAQGYAATSLSQILQEAGANPGSLHHFFPTKEALLSAVLDQLEHVHTHILNQCYPDAPLPTWEASSSSSDERAGGGGQNAHQIDPETPPHQCSAASCLPTSSDPLAIFLFYRDFLRRGDCALGCPVLNLACELSDSHPAVRERLDRLLAQTRARIASTLLSHAYPELLALLITTALHGALIHSRAAKSTAPIEAAHTQLKAILGR